MNEGEQNLMKPRGEKGILANELVDENVLAAETRARSLIERARLSEALKVVEELEKEVADMEMSSRFSKTKKPSESPNNIHFGKAMNPNMLNLTENEYKRKTLLMSLKLIKDNILAAINNLHETVLDIEATKQK